MIKLYFRPLQDESFLSKTEVLSLFGNIQDIYSFQQEFLQSLEEAVEGDLESMNSCSQLKVRDIIRQRICGVDFFTDTKYFFSLIIISTLFQNVLLSIASAFIYYADHFKLYSLFCASHSKAQKALHPSKSR